jgi:hypothetical protein
VFAPRAREDSRGRLAKVSVTPALVTRVTEGEPATEMVLEDTLRERELC